MTLLYLMNPEKQWSKGILSYELGLFARHKYYFRAFKSYPSDGQVVANIAQYHAQITISASVVYELVRGVRLLPDSKKRLKTLDYIESVLSKFPVLPYTEAEAARLQQLGKTASFVDAQIASVAKTNNLILVTRNVDDFENCIDL